MTLAEVRAKFVTEFKTSITRRGILDGLLQVVDKLNEANIVGDLWIDGSFVTEKIDPSDVDYLLHVQSDLYDTDVRKRVIIDWASHEDLKSSLSCEIAHHFFCKSAAS